MENIYLDNAATTPILPEVIDTMTKMMRSVYGNPSSSHQKGRKAKSLVETARKNIARQFKANSNEIIYKILQFHKLNLTFLALKS